MPTSLSFHQLLIFYTVARLGSFSGAAQELSISQPAVSIQVREMERALGTPLIQRRRGDHWLTETGRIVYDYAQRLFALADEMHEVLEDLHEVRAGTLTLGASTTPGEYVLPTVIGRFQQRFPGVEVALRISNSQQIVQQIQRRELDLALVGSQVEDPELAVEPYTQDEIVVIAAPSHPLAQGAPVPMKAMEDYPFIHREEGSATRRIAEGYLQAQGIQVKVAMELGSNEALKRAVAASSALGLISRYAIGPELAASLLTVLPVKGWECTRPLSIVYRKDKHLTSAQAGLPRLPGGRAPRVLVRGSGGPSASPLPGPAVLGGFRVVAEPSTPLPLEATIGRDSRKRGRSGNVLPTTCQVALKEWAVTIEALDQGQQLLLIRKGGIQEQYKEFRVQSFEFLLYPTYDHQREDLLKPAFQEDLRRVLASADGGWLQGQVTFTHWARAEEVLEVTQEDEVERLAPYHMWTNDYAQKRLHWKPRTPLLAMLLRVYRLEKPVTLPVVERYAGCTSWVPLEEEVPLGTLTAVLTDQEFQERAREVRKALGMAALPSA